MMKKILLTALAIVALSPLSLTRHAYAQEPVNIYFFWGEGCPHCEKEKPFLESLENKYENVTVHAFEVWNSSENRDRFIRVGRALDADVSGVPFTVIGDTYVVGFGSAQSTGKTIEDAVTRCTNEGCPDVAGSVLWPEEQPVPEEEKTDAEILQDVIPENSPDADASDDTQEGMPASGSNASANTVSIHFFYTDGCPLCTAEKQFLEQLSATDPHLNVSFYNPGTDTYARELYTMALEEFDTKSTSLPLVAIGQQYFMGWSGDGTTRNAILSAIECAKEERCPDRVQRFLFSSISDTPYEERESILPEIVTLPLLGDVQTKNLSLPVFTFIVAALDGFNPCAMWTLIFLIGLLLGMKDKKRMWTLGIAFIVTSAAVYFLFLSAWLNLLLFIGFILWVRLAIGLVALGGGGYYLKEFFANPHGGCKVTGGEKRQKVFARMKELTHNSNFLFALGGIILLAVAVNLVELICSAGLPAVYTQVLTLSELPMWQYYLYLLFYILIFMLDDLFIFFSAMITLQMTGLSDKYARVSHLIGGTLMLLIGLLLIFKPEWLMFG